MFCNNLIGFSLVILLFYLFLSISGLAFSAEKNRLSKMRPTPIARVSDQDLSNILAIQRAYEVGDLIETPERKPKFQDFLSSDDDCDDDSVRKIRQERREHEQFVQDGKKLLGIVVVVVLSKSFFDYWSWWNCEICRE